MRPVAARLIQFRQKVSRGALGHHWPMVLLMCRTSDRPSSPRGLGSGQYPARRGVNARSTQQKQHVGWEARTGFGDRQSVGLATVQSKRDDQAIAVRVTSA